MPPGNGIVTSSAFTFYGITGQRLGTFSVTTSQYGNSGACSNGARACTGPASGSWLYFGGRLIAVNGLPVMTDRLGSVRSGISYYPWGEEKTSPPTQDGQVKFATYFRDMPGQDYADQRYYNSNAGRFYTPDNTPLSAVDLKNPTSWNKYTYAGDDSVNFNDPSGSIRCWIFGFDFGGVGGNDGGSGCSQDPCTFLINNFGPIPSPFCGYGTMYDVPEPPEPDSINCVGTARVLQGNAKTIGQPGGLLLPAVGSSYRLLARQSFRASGERRMRVCGHTGTRSAESF
jgi:RHS repeat-associated protein